jgi:hypothetical protein
MPICLAVGKSVGKHIAKSRIFRPISSIGVLRIPGAGAIGCYKLRLLTQPTGSEASSYLDHIRLIIKISVILDRVFHLGDMWHPSYISAGVSAPKLLVEALLTRRQSLEEVLGLTVTQLYHVLHPTNQLRTIIYCSRWPLNLPFGLVTSTLRHCKLSGGYLLSGPTC